MAQSRLPDAHRQQNDGYRQRDQGGSHRGFEQ
jgi:hypothetical protein